MCCFFPAVRALHFPHNQDCINLATRFRVDVWQRQNSLEYYNAVRLRSCLPLNSPYSV